MLWSLCRLLKEDVLQDIVREVSGVEGEPLRDKAAGALAPIISWALIWRTMRIAAGIMMGAAAANLLRVFGRRMQRKTHRPAGLSLGSLELGPIAVKRLQLMAAVGLQRLWRQSKQATFASMILGLKIVAQAIRIRRQQTVATA